MYFIHRSYRNCFHTSLNIAHSSWKLNNFISSFTYSLQVFRSLPLLFTPTTSTFLQIDSGHPIIIVHNTWSDSTQLSWIHQRFWVVAQKPGFCHITPVLSDLHWLPVRHRSSFKIATVTFRVLQFQQPSYLASLIPKYVPARALRSSSALSRCVPPLKPPSQPPNHFHLLLQISGTHCQIICHPF